MSCFGLNEGKGRGKKHLSFGVHRVIWTYTTSNCSVLVLALDSKNPDLYYLERMPQLLGSNLAWDYNIDGFRLEIVSCHSNSRAPGGFAS